MDAVEKATALGWKDESQYKGDPEKFVTAEAFLEKADRDMPLLLANNRRLEDELGKVKKRHEATEATLKDAVDAMNEFREYTSNVAKDAYQKAVNDLKKQQQEAAEEGDAVAVLRTSDALADLRDKAPAELKKIVPKEPEKENTQELAAKNPEFLSWVKRNPWVDRDSGDYDEERSQYASSMSAFIRARNPKLSPPELLEKLSEAVEEHFGRPVNRVGGGGRQSTNSSAKSYKNLPADARAACDRMEKRFVGAKGTGKPFESAEAWRKDYCEKFQGWND